MAPKRPQVVFFRASTVRSGSALPSLHQNSQPISQGTYSASSFRRSSTRPAASITSWPTPSPGIHAILYLDIWVFSSFLSKIQAQGGGDTTATSIGKADGARKSKIVAAASVGFVL